MTHFDSSKFVRLIQWAMYLLFIAYWLPVAGNYYFLLKLPVMATNLVLVGSVALVWLWRRRKAHVPHTGLETGFWVLAATQIIALSTSQDWRLSLETVALLGAAFMSFWVIADWVAQGWLESHIITGLFFAAGVVCFAGFWELWQWYQPWTQLGIFIPPVSYRLQSLLSHPNITAQFLNLIVLLAVMVSLRSSSRLARVVLGILIVASAVIIFSTSSRGGWISLAVALSLMLYLHFFSHVPLVSIWRYVVEKGQRLKKWHLAIVGVIFVISTGIALTLMYWQTSSAAKGALLESRSEYWPGAFQLFIAHWLTGVGPGMFTRSWSLVSSLPPLPVVVHAHNMYLLVAVESGIIGIVGVLFLGGVCVVALRRRWQTASEQRWLIAVASGALASLAIHNAFDFLFNSLALAFVVILIAALAFTPRPTPSITLDSKVGWRVSYFLPPTFFGIAFGVYTLWSYAPFSHGLELASQNNWTEASQAMCLSAERDPRFGLYWQGCGVANAHLAEQDMAYYPKAIATLDRASVLDPNWGTNYMNLAMAYARSGQYDLAAQILDVGIKRAPQASAFALNLGWVEEQRERGDLSQNAYHRALDLGVNPQALFWQQTSLRQKTLSSWQQKKNVSATIKRTAQESILYYQSMLKKQAIYPEPYIGLAHAYWAMGDNAQGDFYARQAMSIPVFVPFYLVDVMWLRAEYADRHSDLETARRAGLEYFTQFYDYSFQGIGTWGYANYAWFGYRREGLPSDFVPQIIRADITPEIEERIIMLAEWYAADSKEPVACLMLDRVRNEAPKSKSGELYNKRCQTSANN